jgi:hypothetical protein
MMRARAGGFDVRPGIGSEFPFRQRRKCQQQLSGDQQTKRRQPECRWTDAGTTIEAHHE